jgi:hypothetical protein
MLKSIARGILAVILCIVLVGFGLCGAYGTVAGVADLVGTSQEGRALVPLLLGCGLTGLVIAGVCWKALARLWRDRPRSGT